MLEQTKQATDENTIRRMRFAFCIPKATGTHSEIVILFVFFYGSIVCTNALHCYVYMYVACPVLPIVVKVAVFVWHTSVDLQRHIHYQTLVIV